MRCGAAIKLSLLSLVLMGAGCADVEVRGVVRDKETQAPLQGATVRIGEYITTTDSDGVYSMDVDSDDDPVRVHVDAPTYAAQTDMRPFRDDPDPLYLSFDLEPLQSAQKDKEEGKQTNQTIIQPPAQGSVPAGAPRIKVEAKGEGAKARVNDGEREASAEVEPDQQKKAGQRPADQDQDRILEDDQND